MNGTKGPHIFEQAAAALEEEVWEGAGILEVEASEHNGDPQPVFGMALYGKYKDGLLVRVGHLPTGEPYLLIEGMNTETGDPIPVYARPGPGSSFVTTKTD